MQVPLFQAAQDLFLHMADEAINKIVKIDILSTTFYILNEK